MNKNLKDALAEVDGLLYRTAKSADWLAFFTPQNLVSERQKFLKMHSHSKTYEPQFGYRSPNLAEINNLKIALSNLNTHKSLPKPFNEAYNLALTYSVKMCDLVLAFEEKNDQKVSRLSELIFGRPDKHLVSIAKKVVGGPNIPICLSQNTDKKVVTSDALANAIQERMDQYDMQWQVVLSSESVSRVSVQPIKRVITIRRDLLFSQRDIQKILIHEVDTHMLRAENGKRCWEPGIFEIGFHDAEKVEEGLALYNEQLQQVSSLDFERIIALHVLGINYAASHTFSETFDWVAQYFPNDPDYAFHRVLRWKRGLHRQDRPGAFAKDLVYFLGFLELKNYISRGGKISQLYYGRTNLVQAQEEWLKSAKIAGFAPKVKPVLPIWLGD